MNFPQFQHAFSTLLHAFKRPAAGYEKAPTIRVVGADHHDQPITV